jgi:hypothetical protein
MWLSGGVLWWWSDSWTFIQTRTWNIPWKKASEIVDKTQGRGKNHAQLIHKWVIDFLRWRDLPLHQLNWKRGSIIDDENVAGEIRTKLTEKAGGDFLKAQDIVKIVASLEM